MTITLFLWISFWYALLQAFCLAFLIATDSFPMTRTTKIGAAVIQLLINIVWAYFAFHLIP